MDSTHGIVSWTPMDFVNDGLVTMISRHSVRDLADHLQAVLEKKGMRVFARIDHAANAAAAGMTLRPAEVVIFGNPAFEAELMADAPEIGLDLPWRALAWEDRDGEVWLTFDDGRWLARRHGLGPEEAATIARIVTLMTGIAREATET
jgi:uncharacterized protein (DUF302 family)